jgi:hypothetical protein
MEVAALDMEVGRLDGVQPDAEARAADGEVEALDRSRVCACPIVGKEQFPQSFSDVERALKVSLVEPGSRIEETAADKPVP